MTGPKRRAADIAFIQMYLILPLYDERVGALSIAHFHSFIPSFFLDLTLISHIS